MKTKSETVKGISLSSNEKRRGNIKFTHETKFINCGEEQVMRSGSYYERSYFIFQNMKKMLEGFFQDETRTKFSFTVEREVEE